MPYIDQHTRDCMHGGMPPRNVGELNYAITKLCNEFFKTTGEDYTARNGIIGVLECAKLEFYRRAVAPYEDKKILQNGDVYPS